MNTREKKKKKKKQTTKKTMAKQNNKDNNKRRSNGNGITLDYKSNIELNCNSDTGISLKKESVPQESRPKDRLLLNELILKHIRLGMLEYELNRGRDDYGYERN